MPSTYTTNLGIEKIATGEQSGTWGTTTNTNFDLIDTAVNGIVSITLASAGTSGSPNDLPITDGTASNGRNKFIEFTDGGDLGATAYVQLTPNDAEKIVHIRNSLSGSRSIIVFQGTYNASNDFEIPNGADVTLKFNGGGTGATVTDVNVDLTVTGLTATTANITTVNATTVDSTNLEVTNIKAKDGTSAGSIADSTGVVTLASSVLTTADINGGTADGVTIGASTAAAGTFTTANATTVDTTNLEVTNLKAKDGTSAGSIADSTGVVTLASSVLTTADINGGTIDGTVIGGSSAAAGSFTTLSATGDLTVDTDTLYVDSTNNRVGIGETSPSYQLDVNSGADEEVARFQTTAGFADIFLQDTDTTAGQVRIRCDNNSLSFITNTNVRQTIDSDGNLGIGGTPSTNSGYTTLTLNGNTSGAVLEWENNGTRDGLIYQNGSNDLVIQSESTKDLVFNTSGGNERMRIDSSGNVGIGEDNPASTYTGSSTTLHITDSNAATVVLENTAASTGNAWEMASQNNGALAFRDGGTVKALIDSSGNVGIGTTSPDSILDLEGATPTLTINDTATGTYSQVVYGGGNLVLSSDAGNTGGASTVIFKIDNSERMRLDSSGNVFIADTKANTDSTAKLTVQSDVDSEVKIQCGNNDKARIYFNEGNAEIYSLIMQGTSGSTQTFGLYSDQASSYRWLVNSSGSFLVATTNTNIVNASSGFGAYYDATSGYQVFARNVANSAMFINKTGSSTSTATDYINFRNAGTNVGKIDYDGADVNISQISDQRLKTNITEAESALPLVNAMQVRSFDWVNDIKKPKRFGFVAQELNQAFSDAVAEGGDDENENPWTVSEAKLIPVLTKAIQEQQAMIETLQAQVAELQGA